MSPLARLNPFISASVCPSSFSLTQKASWSEYFSMISTVPSVEPPSLMMYSRLGYSCSSTLLIVASIYRPWLNEGVTTDIFGQSPLLSFMLRSNSHLRSHGSQATSRRLGRVARRRILRCSHPNIPVIDTRADHGRGAHHGAAKLPTSANTVNLGEPHAARSTRAGQEGG